MSFDDWLLALHVLSAFAVVAGLVLFWVLVIAVRRTDTADAMLRMGPLSSAADAVIGAGMGGTIVLGIWLAFSVGGYDIWDPWIVAALVLWAIAGGVGQRAAKAHTAAVKKAQELRAAGETGPSAELLALNREPRGPVMQALASAVVLLIILDMIWKPGA